MMCVFFRDHAPRIAVYIKHSLHLPVFLFLDTHTHTHIPAERLFTHMGAAADTGTDAAAAT